MHRKVLCRLPILTALVVVAPLPVVAGAATLEVVLAASAVRYRDEARRDIYRQERTLTREDTG